MKYTTRQAAKQIGCHPLTLHRLIWAGKIKPKGIPLPGNQTLWQWSDADIAKAKTLVQPHRGRPRKEGAK